MFHTLAYTSIPGGAGTNVDQAAQTDGWATVQNGHYIIPQPLKLIYAGTFSDASPTNLRINTPHFRAVSIPSINPASAAQPGAIANTCFFPPQSITVPAIDEIAMELSNTAAGTLNTISFVGLHDGNFAVPQGDIFTLRATSSITAVAGVWTRGSLTFDQTLPAGTYAIVGMNCLGATLCIARLRFQQYTLLPGALAVATASAAPDWRTRLGRIGEWGRFANTAQPSVEIICRSADTTQTYLIDVVKVA